MSLINDALKKARQAQPANSAAATGPALRPIDISRPRRNPILTLPFAFCVVAVLVLAGVLFAGWYRSESNQFEVRANTRPTAVTPAMPKSHPTPAVELISPAPVPSVAVETLPAPEPAQVIAPTPVVPPIPIPTAKTDSAIESLPATNDALLLTASPAEPLLPPIPLKLQAIFYEPRQPAAMINGRTVSIGGHVGDARVVAIDVRSVTVITVAGRTNVLKLQN